MCYFMNNFLSYLRRIYNGTLLAINLQSLFTDLLDAALFCLAQLAHSVTQAKHPDKTKDNSRAEFLDNLKSPFIMQSDRFSGGDANDCRPEYMVEELCKVLVQLYQKLSEEMAVMAGKGLYVYGF